MLQNAYFLAKIGADKAENELNVAENLPKIGNYPTGPLPYGSTTLVAAGCTASRCAAVPLSSAAGKRRRAPSPLDSGFTDFLSID